jgi:ribosomal protein L29
MKIKEVVNKSDKELENLVADTRKQLAQLAIDMRTKQIPNVKQKLHLRTTLSRALTVQRQRQLEKEENNG